jgi:hypothetical protein
MKNGKISPEHFVVHFGRSLCRSAPRPLTFDSDKVNAEVNDKVNVLPQREVAP